MRSKFLSSEISMLQEVINAEKLSYSYLTVEGYVQALRGISLSIKRGQFVAIIGSVGAGKTTLCRSLTGLIPHYYTGYKEGSIKLFGKEISEYSVSKLASTIGFVFQSAETQLIRMTVEEEVAFGPENLGLPNDEIDRRVASSLELVGLKGLEKRSPYALSGGQKQRLAIASILSMQPEIFVLDEPTSELDPQGTQDVFDVIFKLNKELKKTVILVEQKMEPIASAADRVILLDKGGIIEDGTPREVFSKRSDDLLKLGIRIPEVSQLASMFRSNDDGRIFPTTLEEGIKYFSDLVAKNKQE